MSYNYRSVPSIECKSWFSVSHPTSEPSVTGEGKLPSGFKAIIFMETVRWSSKLSLLWIHRQWYLEGMMHICYIQSIVPAVVPFIIYRRIYQDQSTYYAKCQDITAYIQNFDVHSISIKIQPPWADWDRQQYTQYSDLDFQTTLFQHSVPNGGIITFWPESELRQYFTDGSCRPFICNGKLVLDGINDPQPLHII